MRGKFRRYDLPEPLSPYVRRTSGIERVMAAYFACLTVAIALFGAYAFLSRDAYCLQPYVNRIRPLGRRATVVSYDEESGVYTLFASGEDFRVLHLTDIHLGGSLFSYRKDVLALEACRMEIEHTRPDLVVVTGDLTYPVGVSSLSFNNAAPIYAFAAFMRNIGVPWAFVYGNHDTEKIASASAKEVDAIYRSLSYKTSGTLLYPYVQPPITGRNNQVIEIRESDGSLRIALFLVDSNAYAGAGFDRYDYIRDDQVEWYASETLRLSVEEGRTIPSLLFCHIPLREYLTAYELYLAESDEVEYFFGENGERGDGKVSCSDHPSALFERVVALGSTTGIFCGHDHYNNLSLGYRGVRLTYGMSIDYLAMPGIEKDTKQRGGELITIRPNGLWTAEQIPLESLRPLRSHP